MLTSRKRIAALLVVGAAGIVYFASAADAPPGDVPLTRSYSASTPAKVTSNAKTAERVSAECVGTNACAGQEYGPRVALQAAFAPPASLAAERETKQREVPAPRPPTSKSAPLAEPARPSSQPFVKPRLEQPLVDDTAAAAGALPAEEPAPPPVDAPEQVVRAPRSSMVVGRFQNKASSSYELQRVTCLLDGARVYSGPSAGLAELFRRGLSPGVHQVSVIAEYRGGSSGVFSYTNAYKFTLQGSQRFNVPVGQPAQILATAYERGGPTEPLAKRLALSITTR